MVGLGGLLLLVGLQIIASQEQGPPHGPPPQWANHKCAGPPPAIKNPQKCCEIQQMFTEEEMASCGINKFEEENRQGPPKPPDCNKQECLLKSKDCLNDDGSINHKAVAEHLNNWASEEWKPAVEAAVAVCLGENEVPGPPHICEANRLMFCIGGVIFSECPTWQDNDDCKQLKEHINECKAAKFPPPN
uniref:Odorant-binding protein 10 n=1 Tax=Ectropis obliqua TaxID=248899 RepID=A0A1L2BLF4_ECTOB|nr:odorant-binding protein 10 [Ectropis obliqua]